MIALTTFSGKNVAVFGLGGSGLVTAHALAASGAGIICDDDKAERVKAAADAGLPTGDLRVADFAKLDALILTPGVPLTHPEPHWTVARAKAAGIEIIGDIELFDRERRARIPDLTLVAITGTNGKSTTTALTRHLLAEMGAAVQMGGNIGRPVLDLDPIPGIAIVEVSSFQIDLAPGLTPDVGALLNVSYDHVDRHGTFEAYRAIKERVTDQSAVAVLGHDCPNVNAYARGFRYREGRPEGGVFGFAADHFIARDEQPRRGEMPADRRVFWDVDLNGGIIADSRLERRSFPEAPHLRDVHTGFDIVRYRAREDAVDAIGAIPDVAALRGNHNAQNVAAALTIIMALGFDPKDAVPHLATFPGLPHRMEEVGREGAVSFVNDSKATNADSAKTALKALQNVYWIAGGKAKTDGLTTLDTRRYDIRHAYLIGDAAERFEHEIAGAVPVTQCGTLDRALDAAADDAAAAGGGVVLLSPACASYDQYRSFEERGDVFRALVHQRLEARDG
ncbi:MAG: UDP-N-acetylmuramoyl-L-alanine--D-glutamate ligase [Acuticoccus sp.]